MFQTPKLWLPLAVIACYAIAWASSTDKPNIFLVLIDDQGHNERSLSNPEFRTPTMDKLASEGVILDQMYTQPSCTMSRAALLSGRSPHTMGIENAFDAHDNRYRMVFIVFSYHHPILAANSNNSYESNYN